RESRAPSPSRWPCRAESCGGSSSPPPASAKLGEVVEVLEVLEVVKAVSRAHPLLRRPAPRRSLRGTSGAAPERGPSSVSRVLGERGRGAVDLGLRNRPQRVVRPDVG